jgi:single-strand DNA-binding protein
MPHYNKVLFMGHLTRDPQLKTLPNQTVVAEFGMACNRKWKSAGGEEREEVCFVDCAAFGRTAEVIGEHFIKGRAIFVEGRLKYDTWEDKQSGSKRSKLSIVVDSFQFVGSRGESDEADQRPASKPSANRRPASNPVSEEQQFDPTDVPF